MDTWYPDRVTRDTYGFRGLKGECLGWFDSGPASDGRPRWLPVSREK
nr:MAG TPA: hypothetical protein [Caudoviricetes sp.]DAS02792.1 MAG TPA: hypothetical protein [Caudoviricetes sp.]